MASPKYKLTYFNIRARAESQRLIFAAAGKAFEDERIEFKDWPQIKSKTPLGSLPMLTVDGEIKSNQSMAIARYLAREFGLYGKNNSDMLVIDEVIDICKDLLEKASPALLEQNPEKQKEQFAQIHSETCPRFLAFFENTVSKDGYIGTNSLSVADLVVFSVVENLRAIPLLSKYPKLQANREKVSANKNIEKYLKSRPESDV